MAYSHNEVNLVTILSQYGPADVVSGQWLVQIGPYQIKNSDKYDSSSEVYGVLAWFSSCKGGGVTNSSSHIQSMVLI